DGGAYQCPLGAAMTHPNEASQASAPADPPAQPPDMDLPPHPILIVGIGASAGGLAAFITFLTHMPPDSGMALVLVQHLDPQHLSLLPELLAPHTQMPLP